MDYALGVWKRGGGEEERNPSVRRRQHTIDFSSPSIGSSASRVITQSPNVLPSKRGRSPTPSLPAQAHATPPAPKYPRLISHWKPPAHCRSLTPMPAFPVAARQASPSTNPSSQDINIRYDFECPGPFSETCIVSSHEKLSNEDIPSSPSVIAISPPPRLNKGKGRARTRTPSFELLEHPPLPTTQELDRVSSSPVVSVPQRSPESGSPPIRIHATSGRQPVPKWIKTRKRNPRNQQNVIYKSTPITQGAYCTSHRVLDPQKLYDTKISVLNDWSTRGPMDDSLYSRESREDMEEMDVNDPTVIQIKEQAVVEIALSVVENNMSRLTDKDDLVRLMEGVRVLVIGDGEEMSILAEVERYITKLGGTICRTEQSLFRKEATVYARIVGLSPSSPLQIVSCRQNVRVKEWSLINCIKHINRLCNERILQDRPLDQRFKAMASWCETICMRTGFEKSIYISNAVDGNLREPIEEIIRFEQFTLCESVNILKSVPSRDQILITKATAITGAEKAIAPNSTIRLLSPEGFYTFVSDLRKNTHNSSERNKNITRSTKMSKEEKAFAKNLPPKIATGPRENFAMRTVGLNNG
ncbi:uncharacterized protein IL334_006036 [Kwoniella shivajii]|uniref:BRCT domain-containing protein n=1 Tax=Kwoniella shivajii TaxID=564305 RepID=A0ABZ1D4T1_9TREE|nr:hypothetical protein IL334_006036 [Kwoniella shivajii]